MKWGDRWRRIRQTRKSRVVDLPADNPEGTMDRFREGLRRALSAPKPVKSPAKRHHRKTRRRPPELSATRQIESATPL
jgi:hypothetical protein